MKQKEPMPGRRLIIEGNMVYEIDETCFFCQKGMREEEKKERECKEERTGELTGNSLENKDKIGLTFFKK